MGACPTSPRHGSVEWRGLDSFSRHGYGSPTRPTLDRRRSPCRPSRNPRSQIAGAIFRRRGPLGTARSTKTRLNGQTRYRFPRPRSRLCNSGCHRPTLQGSHEFSAWLLEVATRMRTTTESGRQAKCSTLRRLSGQCGNLFLPQRFHWIDLGGSTRRDPRREEASDHNHQQAGEISDGIGDAHDRRNHRARVGCEQEPRQ